MPKRKLTNGQIVGALNTLAELDKEEFSTKIAFRLSSVGKSLSEAVEAYDEQRKKILNKHAKKDEEGNFVHPLDDNDEPLEDQVELEDREGYNNAIFELMNEEVEIDFKVNLTIDDFDGETLTFNPSKLTPLLAVLEE